MAKDPDKRPTSMIAPKSTAQERLQPVTELATERGVPATALAGMCRAYGWAEGKCLTASAFERAMVEYMGRPMGSGRK